MKTLSCNWFENLPVESGAASVFTAVPIPKSLDEVFFYIDEDTLEGDLQDSIREMLDGLAALRTQAFEHIIDESSTPTVTSFAQVHIDEIDLITEASFALEGLRLRGVGVHANLTHGFTMNIDFGYKREISDELLVVTFSPSAKIISLSHEI